MIHKFISSPRTVGVSALLAITVLSACSGPASDTSADTSVAASSPAVASEGVPPPPGNTEIADGNISTLPPVPLEQPSPLSNGLEVKAVSLDPVELTANGPGEIAGSGLTVTLDFVNNASADISLDTLTVNAYYGDRLPATPGATDMSEPVSGSLAPGDHRQGVYVFQIPAQERDSAIFEVGHVDSENVVAVTR